MMTLKGMVIHSIRFLIMILLSWCDNDPKERYSTNCVGNTGFFEIRGNRWVGLETDCVFLL